jgi:ubiquinol-cytochrome c reductase cytochrome c subunit
MSWKLGRRRRDDRPSGGLVDGATGAGDTAGADGPVPAFRQPPGRLMRRLGGAVRLLAALTIVGGLYMAAAPGVTQADDTPPLSAAAQQGKQLYETTCVTCHGQNGQGVPGRGPSLIGAGSAAVEFQVGTGRMPMAQQGPQAAEKPPLYNWDQARQIGAYIQALGGGPQIPDGDLADSSEEALARGGEIYRINCAACHGYGLGGGALSSGKFAPTLMDSSAREMYGALLTGPQNMPVFGDNQLTPAEKRALIGYIQALQNDRTDAGGFGMSRLGPVPEALVVFLVGMVALVFATLWIAGKS